MHTIRSTIRRGPVGLFAATLLSLAMVLGFTSGTGAVAKEKKSGSPVVLKSDAGKMKSKVKGTTSDGRRVAGTFTPESFSVSNGKLVTTGDLRLVVRGKGKQVRRTVQDVTFTAVRAKAPALAMSNGMSAAAPACNVLSLVLGPLDLDLLGLEIHLDRVVLDIVAQSGAGNLLGNLLCAVVGLLDGTSLGGLLEGILGQLSDLLDQILGSLRV